MQNLMRDYCDVTIHTAAFYGSCVTVKHLLAAGTSPDCRNEEGNTPLMMALHGSAKKKEKDDCVRILLESGADVNAMSEDREPALHMAVKAVIKKSLSKRIIELMIDRGADKNAKDRNGLTASQFAYNEGSSKIGNLILLYVRPYSDEFLSNITMCNITSTKWEKSFEIFSKKEHGLFAEIMSFMFPRQAFYRKLFFDIEELERQKIILRKNKTETNKRNMSGSTNNPFQENKNIRECLSQYEEWRRLRALQRKQELVSLNENGKDLIQFSDEEERDDPSFYIRRKSSSRREQDIAESQPQTHYEDTLSLNGNLFLRKKYKAVLE